MYHVTETPPAGTPQPELWVPADRFAAEMALLRKQGYRAVTLHQVFQYWNRKARLPRHPLVITFDDGYRSNYRQAFPVLRRMRWPAVLNLTIANIGKPDGLLPVEVRRLAAAGWEIDSHTISHTDLTTLAPAALRREIAGSRRELQRRFRVPVDFFCYPSGRFNDRVVEAVKRAGYIGATTTQPGFGKSGDPYRLARTRVNGSDGPDNLARELTSVQAR